MIYCTSPEGVRNRFTARASGEGQADIILCTPGGTVCVEQTELFRFESREQNQYCKLAERLMSKESNRCPPAVALIFCDHFSENTFP